MAQEPARVTGRVTDRGGVTLPGAQVSIPSLGIGASTRGDGTYNVLIPSARVPAGAVSVTARLIGYRLDTVEVRLSGLAGETVVADFSLAANPLEIGEIVVTGAGTVSEVEKLGTVRNTIDGRSIVSANEQNLVSALAAKAPNVSVTSSSGDPGSSTYIQIRGITSIESSDGQPLFVIDGLPVDNSTTFNNPGAEAMNGGHIFPPNRLIDLNPDDIERVEILKGASSGAIYGSRAGQGVVLITTRKGRPGQTTYSLRSSWSLQNHTQLPALQTRYGHGSGGVTPGCVPSSDLALLNCRPTTNRSYGPELPEGAPTYDHAAEIFRTGYTTDNALTVSGGSDRTRFFLSGGYSYNRGIVVGENNSYRRISVRLNGSHQITDRLNVGANVAYNDGSGAFVETRNSTAGLLLGAWRTPPEFNNLPYLDPIYALHRSYRFPNPGPGSEQSSRGYDNPFFVAHENPATSHVSRTFGGITADWAPTSWLRFNETLGLDYSNDERFATWAWTTSNVSTPGVFGRGGVHAGYIREEQLDHNLTATATYGVSRSWIGSITLGQNLNSRSGGARQTLGSGLITAEPFKLGNTAELFSPAADGTQRIRVESYFAQVTADLWDQLHLTAAVRNDGVSSFGPESRRHWFPKASAAWVFRRDAGGNRALVGYGKLRAAYGQTGTRPPPYALASVFVSNGVGGLVTAPNRAATGLGPERVKELEAGVDLALAGDRADLSVTHYRQNSTGVILVTPIEPSTGYSSTLANAASLQNRGWEVTLNLRSVPTARVTWDVQLNWARNRGVTTALANGVQRAAFPFEGGTGGCCVQGVTLVGQPIGVYDGLDWVRCGRGTVLDDIALDATPGHCAGVPAGALYLGPDGTPVLDEASTVIGDPNPDWTGSVRAGFRIGKLAIGGLVDVRHGGVGWNGTQGALNEFGTGLNTAEGRAGPPVVFGTDYYPGLHPTPVAGPGVGIPVQLDETWFTGKASVFSGISSLFIEDAGWVKLREISLAYTLDQPWVGRRLGFQSVELRIAGRNLKSWNRYSGVDPETAVLGAASPVRGLNYFNNPQTRAWVFSVTLTR